MSGEGFLSRWSRRKRAAEAGLPVAEPDSPQPAAPPALSEVPPPPAPAEPEFDPASLPPVESLTAESDFTAFLRKEVPEALKRAALRKAWALDPAIRDFVGPADYAWDYNAPDGVPGFALELGGDVRKLLAQAIGLERDEEAAEAARLAAAAQQPPATEDGASTPEAEAAPAPSATPADAPAIALASPDPAPEAKATPGATPRRHGSALPS